MSTGLDVFDSTIEKSNKILSEIEDELGWNGRRNQSYLALRSVLHALRDRLTVDDAVNFSAQLPLMLKGVFFDGWKSESVPIRMDKSEFLGYIAKNFKFSTDQGIEKVVKVVFDKIFSSIDKKEVNKLLKMLPDDIKELLNNRNI